MQDPKQMTKDESKVSLMDPQKWVDIYGDQLYAHAFARVQSRMVAEDLVQETFLAALSGANAFEGRSSEKTWLTAILRNKIIDHFRGLKREQPTDPSQDHEKQLDYFFHENGSWKHKPENREVTPSELLDQKEFWTLFQRCLSELSERLRTAFSLREMEGLTCNELCKILDVSSSNCWVMVYGLNPNSGSRARLDRQAFRFNL